MDFSLTDYYDCAQALLKAEGRNNEIFFVYVKGSQNYGLDTATSDVDVVVVIFPSIRDVAENQTALSKTYSMDNPYFSSIKGNEKGLVSFVDVRNYFKGLQRHNFSYLEGLFTSYIKVTPYLMKDYQDLKQLSQPLAKASVRSAIHTLVGASQSAYCNIEKKLNNNDIVGANKKLASFFRFSYMISEYLKQRKSYCFDYSKCLYFENITRRNFLIGLKREEKTSLYKGFEQRVKRLKERNSKLLTENLETEEDAQMLAQVIEKMDTLLRKSLSLILFFPLCHHN